jgi:protein TonB
MGAPGLTRAASLTRPGNTHTTWALTERQIVTIGRIPHGDSGATPVERAPQMNDRLLLDPPDRVTPARRPRMPNRGMPNRGMPNRALTITLAASFGLHLVALMTALLLLRAPPVVDGPDKPTEVELVMEEHKGDASPTSPSQTKSDQPAEEQSREKPADMKPPVPPAEKPVETPPVTRDAAADPGNEPVPSPAEAQTPAQKTPPPAPEAMKITLQGTDSPSDAKAWGERVIPAAPDAVFHNRPPEYPEESVVNGEHGTVVLLIHVSTSGRPAGVDVLRSSGYVLLDSAAREAMTRWRFLPAFKDGHPVTSDMTMGFVFGFD